MYLDQHLAVFRDRLRNIRRYISARGTRAKVTVAEVEHLVPSGTLDGDHIITSGVFVQRLVVLDHLEKRIEQRTVRHRAA